MKRLLLTGIAIFVAWTLLDVLAHRAVLQPLYASNPALWRPASELNPALVTGVTFLRIAVFVSIHHALVRPKSVARGVWFGGLVGLALGTASGLGTYIHSPIPGALACGWLALGTLKGLAAGALLGAHLREGAA